MQEDSKKDRVDLAAALFNALGTSVPHKKEWEPKAQELTAQMKSRESALKKVVELCQEPETPRELYLSARACSHLGGAYTEKAVSYATQYLYTPGWEELPQRVVQEEGVLVDHWAASRAEIFMDLSTAQAARGQLQAALDNCREAYRLQPYNAMYPGKAAGLLCRMGHIQEALDYLHAQERSRYYPPVKYHDSQGNVRINDTFRQMIQAEIRKLEAAESSSGKW